MSGQFSLSWDNFHKNMSLGMNSLLEKEDFVDVTLGVEGRYLKAHKMVLSMCSPYFRELFKTSPCKHPIVFMKDVSYDVMSDLLQFMYQGEVRVTQENFTTFIQTAESLQITGLSGQDNGSIEPEISEPQNSKKSRPAKRPRLSEPSPTTQPTTVKPEAEETISQPIVNIEPKADEIEATNEFKIEHSSVDNFSDENPLDEAIADDTNEDFWMMEDEAQTSGNDPLEGEASDSEEATVSSVLPEKSKDRYEYTFNCFEQWCSEHDVKTISEDVLMTYFKEKSTTHKSSSLLTTYSMLKSMISIKKNQDISIYKKLLAFLKKQAIGYQAKTSKIFKREELERFLKDADDHTYLLMKVAVIIAVVGGCNNVELAYLLKDNVIDEGNFFRIILPDSKTKNVREFILTTGGNLKNVNVLEILRKYIKLRPNHRRFFLCYRNGKCVKQPAGVKGFGPMPKTIAQFLGLKNPEHYTGHCFKKTSTALKMVPQFVHL